MKAELVKREDHWALYNEDGHKIAATIDGCKSKLSLKNCQAIANGYDLDELSHKEYLLHENNDELYGDSLELRLAYKAGVYDGLKRMLTVLGDKNFSEEDVRKAIDIAWRNEESNKIDIIQSIKKTEWDVEICCYVDNSNGWLDADSFNSPLLTNTGIPKLDSDGFLILKRI